MPTGYTADVASGKVINFNEFAMQCARAFGACITMRDEPDDAVIPDQFEPSDYNAQSLAEAREELIRLEGLSLSQQDVECCKANDAAFASWNRRQKEKADIRDRYEAMLVAVSSWSPPTAEHVPLKEFMVEQLRESIAFDCGTSKYDRRPVALKRSDWHESALAKARRDIAYHDDENRKEIERARSRTEWVRALRNSLKQNG